MVNNFHIGSYDIGVDPCYIIAEAGSNHDQNKSRAFEMIRYAADAGANAVKFQLFKAERIAANMDIPEVRLSAQFAKFGETAYDLYKHMELPDSWLQELKACCTEHGVDFLATPFDEISADKLAETCVSAIKIASFEITHIPLLKYIGKMGLPVILSTGMANTEEIEEAINAVCSGGENRICLLHCGIDYPTPLASVNLRCLKTLSESFDYPVGYSDHTEGTIVPVAAVAVGAVILEKHITLEGGKSPDHDFAINVTEFADMVKAVRQCELALGSPVKKVEENEKEHLHRGRRSLFVVKDVKKGEIFTRENMAVLRPGIGLPPVLYEEVLGKKAVGNIEAPAILKEGDWS